MGTCWQNNTPLASLNSLRSISMRSDKQKGSGRAAVRQLLVFDHLDRVAAPILASIAERVKSAAPGLLGVRLAFDKEVATSLQDNPAWRLARSELLSSLVAHVSHNPLLLGLEIPRMPLPAMYCHSLSAALRSGKGGEPLLLRLQP